MKRKDKYTIDQVLDMIESTITTSFKCSECVARNICKGIPDYAESCMDVIREWLNQEVVMKPRHMTFKTAEDVDKAIHSFFDRSNTINDLVAWLCEEIEAEE